MGVLKLFEGTGDMYCAVATIRTAEGSMQKVVDGTAFSVGRAPDCVLSIPDVGISRLHMLVTIKKGEIYITDQGSSNGTFLNGEKIEPKRLIHVKPVDEIKLGKSDVILQFGCIEKHFKTDYIAESLLPTVEKDNLLSLIKASHHKAQEIVGMAQSQAEQLVKVATEKARNTENQTLLRQEEILSKAQVESQQIISDTKRKSAQMIQEAEEKAMQATENIRLDAENRRKEAETYYQDKVKGAEAFYDDKVKSAEAFYDEKAKRADSYYDDKIKNADNYFKEKIESAENIHKDKVKSAESFYHDKLNEADEKFQKKAKEAEEFYNEKIIEAQSQGEQIIAKHTKMGQDMVEELRIRTIEKAEKEAKEKLSSLFTALDEKSEELEKLKVECKHFENEQRKIIENELNDMRQEFIKKFEYEKESTLDEHESRLALLETEYLHKKQEFEEEESNRIQKLEDRIRKLNDKLDHEYAEKKVRLEKEFADRMTSTDREYKQRKTTLEEDFQSRQTKLNEEYESNRIEFTTSLEKQRNMLEKEVEGQRQTLQIVRSEIDNYSEQHLEIKSKFESLSQTVKGLQKSESELIQLLDDKRKQLSSVQDEHKRVSELIDDSDKKYTDLQKAYGNLKVQYENDHLNYRKELDAEMQKLRSEFKKKTSEYEELERIKLEDYKTKIAFERKQLDSSFERTKKEFEDKTKEVIEFEKKKLEDAKLQYLALMNSQRVHVVDELTKAVLKIEKRGDPVHSPQLIAAAVTSVFDSNVAEFSLTANAQSSAANSRNDKVKWLSYGFSSAFALVFGFVFLVQPQINKHIQGTEENIKASVVKERPKFQPEQDLEFRDSYTDKVIYTSKFTEIYLDEEIHDKWFKYISDYMFQTWRVPEEKTIEAVAMAKSLVDTLKNRYANLDAEFAEKGVEKLREVENETIQKMGDILGTQVKFEAYKRKEREFFEPYIQNQ
jgi:pSer/pThr/pTyr-binding forkhead associated (FHA) protein